VFCSIIDFLFLASPCATATVLCGAKSNKSFRQALSIIDKGHITKTRFTLPCCIRKSDAHIALAVLPVPCSLKQKDFLCCVKNNAVLRWCLNGLCLPEKVYFCCSTSNVFSLLQQIKSAFFVVFLGYNHTRDFRFVAVRALNQAFFFFFPFLLLFFDGLSRK